MTSKWCLPLSGVRGHDHASDKSRACQRKAGRSCAPTQTWASTPGRRESRAGLSRAISAGSRRRSAHRRESERLQIGHRRDRHDPLNEGRQRQIRATHAAAQMAARGVASDDERTCDEARRDVEGARDLMGHRADPGFGRERVGGQGAGPAARDCAGGEMRPHFTTELQPIAAMNEHQKSPRRGFRQKEVELVARFRTIRDPGSGALPESRSKFRRFSHPARRKGLGAGDEGAVGVGAVVIHSGVPRSERQVTRI